MIWAQFEYFKDDLRHVFVLLLLEDDVDCTEVLIGHHVVGQARSRLLLTTVNSGSRKAQVGRISPFLLLGRRTCKHLVHAIAHGIWHMHAHNFILKLTTADCLTGKPMKELLIEYWIRIASEISEQRYDSLCGSFLFCSAHHQ